ncbi:class I adenylate-forming enzyme family protein [Sinimarinibacterium thermocellulolyticum]|uniref:AMP-binding protein n=1 Tax=Sinimarinibacterium thermocellulolyticum TaxID=3170016 RepID=A0ABV2ADR5_9GAMM
MHFSRYIRFWAQRRGDAIAISCAGQRLTWREIDRDSAVLAGWLASQGVHRGDRLGCLLGNSLAWCVAFFASLRMGAIFVPLNPLFGRFELEQIALDAGCAAVLSTPSLVERIGIVDRTQPTDRPRLYLRNGAQACDYTDALATSLPFEERDLSDDDVMMICYTSGTTGVPKGATFTHRAVDAAMQGLILNFGLRGAEERFLILAPLAFTGGVISNLAPMIVVGASTFLEPTVDPARAFKLLTEEHITYFGGVPALWERIAMAPGFTEARFDELRSAYTGGAPVPRPLLEKFLAKGVTIRQQYGCTEACGGVSSPDAAEVARNPVSCGHALPGVEIELRDEHGQTTPRGEVGEICLRGPQLMSGYWNNEAATQDAFDGDWYRSGDLGRYDEHGGLIIVDRKKNMLISGGVNIYPAEVERALASIPGIIECVVFGLPSTRWGQEVAAMVYAPDLNDADLIREQARQLLGAVKAPKHLRLSPQPLPKTPSNKIARTRLPELFASLS